MAIAISYRLGRKEIIEEVAVRHPEAAKVFSEYESFKNSYDVVSEGFLKEEDPRTLKNRLHAANCSAAWEEYDKETSQLGKGLDPR